MNPTKADVPSPNSNLIRAIEESGSKAVGTSPDSTVFYIIVFLTVVLISTFVYYSVLSDILSRKFKQPTDKLVWLLAFWAFPVITPLFYTKIYIKKIAKNKRSRRF
ncbi:MAG: hypothetical protein A3A58_03710 [Candidatus Blackburnbacteria bacterium RIFCSPLOWO2_01_FULL_41_27]|uniref:Cardiolipin synthase N-terminal domain-containing protein n=2 Tax=Candidatus Blackburniibacteriota TaxID=1817898 RepID=A0A1G1V6F8_9BACT|nr:MAG: hypothetical protein A3F61_02720 [Candidatus Blackburnbacteria bacterium RIFCSPHIGHO2_12_FULL_41_13b]OGY14415.1 MAG: hypothetical protein A3A58_03710 [Candidatus Blackburnbacteria bacterium RIFCSPLOWO2_01_FULL_41_27]